MFLLSARASFSSLSFLNKSDWHHHRPTWRTDRSHLPMAAHLPSPLEGPGAGRRGDRPCQALHTAVGPGPAGVAVPAGPFSSHKPELPHALEHTAPRASSGGQDERERGVRSLRGREATGTVFPWAVSSPLSPAPLSAAGDALHMWYARPSHAALPIHLSVHVCLALSHVCWFSIKSGTRAWHGQHREKDGGGWRTHNVYFVLCFPSFC